MDDVTVYTHEKLEWLAEQKLRFKTSSHFFFLILYHSNSFFLSTFTICSHSSPLIFFSFHIHPSSHSPSSTSSHHYPFLHSPSSTFTFPHIYHSLPSPSSSTFNICHIHPLQSLPFFITLFTFILQYLSPSHSPSLSLLSPCSTFTILYIHFPFITYYFHPPSYSPTTIVVHIHWPPPPTFVHLHDFHPSDWTFTFSTLDSYPDHFLVCSLLMSTSSFPSPLFISGSFSTIPFFSTFFPSFSFVVNVFPCSFNLTFSVSFLSPLSLPFSLLSFHSFFSCEKVTLLFLAPPPFQSSQSVKRT